MERKIGEVFTYNGEEFKSVEDEVEKRGQESCMRCVWSIAHCLNIERKRYFGECEWVYRTDLTSIHFERV